MDSTLLDQIRHLCRDRSAYEHLKAILVQQERVHQLSWEERYEKLMSAQVSDQQTDLFRNIIAREKSLAQLADAIQRSPSLELVLQIAVQVAQKLLQVDRVAIFQRYPDGRGEFVTDAIASGLMSLADMPERQLTLAKHIIESTEVEHSPQSVDSIRSSSLSSHIVTLLEQIGISSYAVNKIYAGHEVWGTLVAFQGSAYHSWSESDRTSLSLIASQLGIAISLTNLRQQSQDLTQDLEDLQNELTLLQQAVKDISQQEAESIDADVEPLKPELENPELENPELENPSEETPSTEAVELVSSSLIEDAEDLVEVVETDETIETDETDETIETIETIETDEIVEVAEVAEVIEPTDDLSNDDGNDHSNDVNNIEQSANPSITDGLISEEIEQPEITSESLISESLTQEETQEEQALAEDLDENLSTDLDTDLNADLNENGESIENRDTDSLNVEQPEQPEQPEQILNVVLDQIEQHLEDNPEEILYSGYLPISNNGVPALFLLQNPVNYLPDEDLEEDSSEEIVPISTAPIIIEINQDRELANSFLEDVDTENIDTENIETSEIETLESSISASEVIVEELVTAPVSLAVEENISTSIPPDSTELETGEITPEPEETEVALESETGEIIPDSEEAEVALESETEAIAHVSEISPKNSEEIANDENLGSTETFQDERKDEPEEHQQVSVETHAEITASQEIAEMPSEVVEPQASEVPNEATTETEQPVAIAQPTPENLTTIITDPDEERDPAIEPQFIETILSISGDDSKGIKFLLGVIDTYLEETPKLVQTIDKAIASNDHPKLLHLINTLRTSSDYVGALALSYQCRQLESAVRANYVVLIYACLSQVAIEAQRATDALRIEREKYSE